MDTLIGHSNPFPPISLTHCLPQYACLKIHRHAQASRRVQCCGQPPPRSSPCCTHICIIYFFSYPSRSGYDLVAVFMRKYYYCGVFCTKPFLSQIRRAGPDWDAELHAEMAATLPAVSWQTRNPEQLQSGSCTVSFAK